ncbi:uncharacterized protein LOC129798552 [Phlebotomus papatasi]|uniref:uncharacterized protein LOC129798552 n=1 Tax=Phlebotomus papatasi TaxID=29031 RepID=UPI002483FC3E|nr:uncharacterized protein LOC129798552 [Phlebotomus papatasi]
MDYFSSLLGSLGMFLIILLLYRLCTLCCPSNANSQAPTDRVHVVIISSDGHAIHRRMDYGDFHALSTREQEPRTGFTPVVISGASQSEIPSIPSYSVGDFPPRHETTSEVPSNINPPSYEQAMDNETFNQEQRKA